MTGRHASFLWIVAVATSIYSGCADELPVVEDESSALFDVKVSNFCNDDQKAQLARVVPAALSVASSALTAWRASENRSARGQRWFGTALSAEQKGKVADTFQKIQAKLASEEITYDCVDECTKAVAFVADDPNLLYVCPQYWALPDSGLNSKIDTIIHEVSHIVGIKDIGQGILYSELYAQVAPDRAINNADNYAYFTVDNTNLTIGPRAGRPPSVSRDSSSAELDR